MLDTAALLFEAIEKRVLQVAGLTLAKRIFSNFVQLKVTVRRAVLPVVLAESEIGIVHHRCKVGLLWGTLLLILLHLLHSLHID